jgi:hypothetical protein
MTTSSINSKGETFEVGDIVAFNEDNFTLHYHKGDLVRLTHIFESNLVHFEKIKVADPDAEDTTHWPIGWFTKQNGLPAWRSAVAAGETIQSFEEWSTLASPRCYSLGLPVSIVVNHATGEVSFDVDLSEACDLSGSQPDTDDHVDDDSALVSAATATVSEHFTFTISTKA